MGICISAAARVKAESPSHTGVHLGSPDESSSINASVPPPPRSEGDILQSPNLKRFSFSNLKLATKNFRSNNVVGEGGFGMVFKGWLDENTYAASKSETGMLVAVKRLNQESAQGHREWLAEVNYLGQFSHPHLVKLIGFCLEDAHRLLVYEFVPRGSLEYHLFRRGSYHQPLSWELRLKVAIGAAKGLAFLHSAETKVIYRDFKTANVLLDSDYNAKLSDFGLARDAPTDGKSHVSTRIMGTQGYAAPEYLATGHLTAKSDVYSFGVVLLEMLSGRKAVDYNRPSGEHNLVEWARPFLTNKRKIFKFLDTRIEGQCKLDAAHKVATLACRCISVEARFRPSMAEVLTELERIQDYKDSENSENGTRDVTRFRGKGVVDAASIRSPSTVFYPRPSDSPLYA